MSLLAFKIYCDFPGCHEADEYEEWTIGKKLAKADGWSIATVKEPYNYCPRHTEEVNQNGTN